MYHRVAMKSIDVGYNNVRLCLKQEEMGRCFIKTMSYYNTFKIRAWTPFPNSLLFVIINLLFFYFSRAPHLNRCWMAKFAL